MSRDRLDGVLSMTTGVGAGVGAAVVASSFLIAHGDYKSWTMNNVPKQEAILTLVKLSLGLKRHVKQKSGGQQSAAASAESRDKYGPFLSGDEARPSSVKLSAAPIRSDGILKPEVATDEKKLGSYLSHAYAGLFDSPIITSFPDGGVVISRNKTASRGYRISCSKAIFDDNGQRDPDLSTELDVTLRYFDVLNFKVWIVPAKEPPAGLPSAVGADNTRYNLHLRVYGMKTSHARDQLMNYYYSRDPTSQRKFPISKELMGWYPEKHWDPVQGIRNWGRPFGSRAFGSGADHIGIRGGG